MFKTRVYLFSILWVALVAICYFSFRVVTQKDKAHYQKLITLGEKKESKNVYQTQQKRFHVTKHLFLAKGRDRLHMHLRSESSDLVLSQQDGNVAMMECFKGVKCTQQEALVYVFSDGKEVKCHPHDQKTLSQIDFTVPLMKEQQVVRQIDADKATYHYKTKELLGEQVKFSRYIASGHDLKRPSPILSSLMNGTAKKLQISLSDTEKPFKAEGFKATFKELKE